MRNYSPVRRGMHPANAGTDGTNGSESHASPDSEARNGRRERDIEKKERRGSFPERRRSSFVGRDDPFGNEEDAEVKYRTLRWWYVETKGCALEHTF